MNITLVSDDFRELDNIDNIEKLANAWYYSPDDEVSIYLGLLLISSGVVYFIRRYGTIAAYDNFLKVSKMRDKYDELIEFIQKSTNLNTLNNICQQNFLTLEIEDWGGDDPLYQMYYPESSLYCLEPSDEDNWINETIDQIPLPTYDE